MKLHYLLSVALLALAPAPLIAQDANVEGRVTKLEKEMKAVQRKVFPDGAGKFFEPEIKPDGTKATTTGTPSPSAVTDLIARVDALEAQLATLTGQVEQNTAGMKSLEARVKSLETASKTVTVATPPAAAPEWQQRPNQPPPPSLQPPRNRQQRPSQQLRAPPLWLRLAAHRPAMVLRMAIIMAIACGRRNSIPKRKPSWKKPLVNIPSTSAPALPAICWAGLGWMMASLQPLLRYSTTIIKMIRAANARLKACISWVLR
jgi:hypothetical protein